MTSTIVNAHQNLSLGKFHVNVTTRAGQMLGVETLMKLTVDTVRAWMKAAKAFEAGERKVEGNAPAFEQLITLATPQPFVTVWGEVMHNGETLTLTAHDAATPQELLDTAWANMDACNQIREALAKAAQVQQPAAPVLVPPAHEDRRIPTPEPKSDAPKPDIGQVRHIGTLKKGVEVIDGELVSFDVAKIELEETNGNKSWKFYNFFGSKAGKFPAGALTVYGDNELSMKAVGASLVALALQPGGAIEGRWRAVYRIRVSGEKTYYNPIQLAADVPQQKASSF